MQHISVKEVHGRYFLFYLWIWNHKLICYLLLQEKLSIFNINAEHLDFQKCKRVDIFWTKQYIHNKKVLMMCYWGDCLVYQQFEVIIPNKVNTLSFHFWPNNQNIIQDSHTNLFLLLMKFNWIPWKWRPGLTIQYNFIVKI